ncbi:MAG: carboxypeptidase regulatory-like domain-containing protein [Candidatus Bathyarchaeota archaeon]|nr:carboxypeptidase regulatory-like domain-containing protein [Candidatus Bathyarchaeota archaeon]MDH5495419.1 carboxypeptidase regulatory-like domain-containing protein [Candidatus Bathyarchaeota archaeon]
MVVELRSTIGHLISKTNSTTLVLFVCISIILSSSALMAVTNVILVYRNDRATSSPEPPPEETPSPDPSSEPALGWIVGIVTETSTPRTRIKGATVKIDETYATSDVRGYYRIEVPAPGRYNLTASANSYYSQTVTDIFVNIQATVVVNFYLTLAPSEFEPVAGKHDIAVSSISSLDEAYQGQVILIEVYLLNLGDYEEIFGLAVTYDEGSVGIRTVSLASKDTKIETFSWNTSDTSPAPYTITAEAILATDETQASNTANTSIVIRPSVGWIEGYVTDRATSLPIVGATVSADTHIAATDLFGYYNIEVPSLGAYYVIVTADGYYNETKSGIFVDILATVNVTFALMPIPKPPVKIHDVAITNLSAPPKVYLGNIVTINVGVKNLGDYEETFDIEVAHGTTSIDTRTLTLTSKDSITLSFNWNTSNIAPDEYCLTAEAILETDENPTNNQTAIKISIDLEQPEATFTWIGQHVNLTLAEWAYNLSFQNVVVRYDPDQNRSMQNLARYDIRFWRWVPYYLFENAETEKDFADILQGEISASPSKRIYIDDVDALYMLYGASALSNLLKAIDNVQHNNIILCFYMSSQTPYQGLYQFIDQYDWSNFHVDIYSPPNVDFSALIPLLNARTLGTYLWLWSYGGLGYTWKNVSLNDIICRYGDAINHEIQRFAVWTGYEPETHEVGMETASLYTHSYWWNKIAKYNRNFLEGEPIPRDRGVILWFDDGLLNTYEAARPILRHYGYTGVVSAITWMARNYESERYVWDDDQWKDKPIMILQELFTMQNEGWEIVSHSQSHPHLSSLQEYFASWEIEGSKEWIDNHFGPIKNPCFVYPYGEVHWDSIVDEQYVYQRLGEEGQEPRMIWNPNDEYYRTHIPIVGTSLSTEMIDYWLNETNQKGGIGVFALHGIYENPELGSQENSMENLEYLLKKLKNEEMPVLTLTQATELFQIKSQGSLFIEVSAVLNDKIEDVTVKREIINFCDLQKLTSLYSNIILCLHAQILIYSLRLQNKLLKVERETKRTTKTMLKPCA